MSDSDTDQSSNDDIEYLNGTETKDALSVVFNTEIRPLIDLIDKLRRFGIQQDIALPNVVVVGDQSSGKSSIIEALSGVELPRGKGIVTRCPLELQLKRVHKEKWRAKLSYRDKNGQIIENDIFDPKEVELGVRKAQEALCGGGKGVSSELITLRIESPKESAPDLTLIDLPGIARIALDDQPANVCEIINKMIMSHVSSPRTVILCVISAHLDIAVNESLKIARSVDPEGERTIGVLTKPDVAEESHKEDVLCLLNNEKVKLQKGFSMVKCRSQKDLDNKISLKKSLQNEKEFFKNDRTFSNASSSQVGIMMLARKISEELVNVIKKSLPELKDQIESCLRSAHAVLEQLAETVPTDTIEKQTYLTRTIWSLLPALKDCLNEGKDLKKDENYFYGWRKHFKEFLKAMEDKTKHALTARFSENNLRVLIERNRGLELVGFHDFDLFKKEIPKHIETYLSDAINLLGLMKKNVETCITRVISNRCDHLPEILMDLKGIIVEEMKKSQEIADEKIKFLFKQEYIIFTMDVVFNRDMNEYKKRKAQAIADAEKRSRNFQPTLSSFGFEEEEDHNASEMHDMLQIYLTIVNHRLSDNIPLTIMQCLLIDLEKSIESRFINLCSAPNVVAKVRENKTLLEKRDATKAKIKRLQDASRELARF